MFYWKCFILSVNYKYERCIYFNNNNNNILIIMIIIIIYLLFLVNVTYRDRKSSFYKLNTLDSIYLFFINFIFINLGIYSDAPYLKVTEDLFNKIILITFGQQRSLFKW